MTISLEEIHRRWQQTQRPVFTRQYLTYLLRSGSHRLFWEYDQCLLMPKPAQLLPVQAVHFIIWLN
jgi:hypothetical protein